MNHAISSADIEVEAPKSRETIEVEHGQGKEIKVPHRQVQTDAKMQKELFIDSFYYFRLYFATIKLPQPRKPPVILGAERPTSL